MSKNADINANSLFYILSNQINPDYKFESIDLAIHGKKPLWDINRNMNVSAYVMIASRYSFE